MSFHKSRHESQAWQINYLGSCCIHGRRRRNGIDPVALHFDSPAFMQGFTIKDEFRLQYIDCGLRMQDALEDARKQKGCAEAANSHTQL